MAPRSHSIRLAVLAPLLGLALASGCGEAAPAPVAVLLVTLDTTRADRLGSYGYPRATTPELDRLAAESIRFEHAISSSGATPMAHASILTGLEPYQHGVRVISGAGAYRLPDDIPTLASILAARGFTTAAFLSAFTVSSYYGLDQGFDVFDSGIADPAAVLREEDGAHVWEVSANQRRADLTTDRFLAWLEECEAPFFAWIHFWDPHDDHLLPPDDVVARFARGGGERRRRSDLYDAELFFVDRQIGRIRRALEARGLWQRSIVVVIGDHGEGLGDHGWDRHRRLYQEQIRIPLIVSLPGLPAGEVDALVRGVDVLPTLAEALDVAPPGGIAGRSLLPLMRGERDGSAEPRIAYAEQLNEWDSNAGSALLDPRDRLLYSVQDRDWKLIHRARTPEQSELFHLATDPGERYDLYAADHPQALRLQADLDARDAYRTTPFEGAAPGPDVLERLRDLGYLEEGS